mmetsp:Transcript_15715/g.23806  ORF Transcript_15715/g.23806 Transcript_15715/m.23806 type:complete len:505 (+) Transcript_15715:278-1792(+)
MVPMVSYGTLCLLPAFDEFSLASESNPNYFSVGECTGDHMRFLLTSNRRIQSVTNPNYCAVAHLEKEEQPNQEFKGIKIALQDCSNVRDPFWRPSTWSTFRPDWPTFIIVYSKTFFAWEDVIVSYILPFSTYQDLELGYNISILPDGVDTSSYPESYSLSTCTDCVLQSGNVTFSKNTVPITEDGDFVAVIRIGQVVYATSSPFSMISPPPTISPYPTISNVPSPNPSISEVPSAAPSFQPSLSEIPCDVLTIEYAFTQAGSVIPGIIVAIISIVPVICYMSQTKTSCAFRFDVLITFVEKLYCVTTLLAALITCVFGPRGNDEEEIDTYFDGLTLAIIIIVEFLIGVLGYVCCAGDGFERNVNFDSGMFVLSYRWCKGLLLACLLLVGGGAVTFYQMYYFYVQKDYEVKLYLVIIGTAFTVLGLIFLLLGIFVIFMAPCSQYGTSDKNGEVMYFYWRMYKLLAGVIPGVIFSFISGNYLAITWTVELVSDLIHLAFNCDSFGE